MPSMAEMVDAHLKNVKRELDSLTERKSIIEQDIQKLEMYLQEGVTELNSSAGDPPVVPDLSSVYSSVDNTGL